MAMSYVYSVNIYLQVFDACFELGDGNLKFAITGIPVMTIGSQLHKEKCMATYSRTIRMEIETYFNIL